MKTYLALCVLCLGITAGHCQYYADKIPHYPTISQDLATTIAAKRLTFTNWPNYPNKLVTTEGVSTDEYSSTQGVSDYYAVRLNNNTNGGRLLKITMTAGPFTGLAQTPTVVDANTGERFVLTLDRYDVRQSEYDYTADTNGYLARFYHTGSMVIDGDTISVRVRYWTPVYPSMVLTWGAGSSPLEPGFFQDHLENTPVGPVPSEPRIHWSTMTYVDDGVDPLFPVTFAEVSSERAYEFETSTNLATWTPAESVYIQNNTNNNHQIWGIIHPVGTNKAFTRFRMVE